MGEAEELCDRVGIMVNGEIIAMDTAAGLKERFRADGAATPTLEEVFMAATGTSLEEADQAAETDDEEGA